MPTDNRQIYSVSGLNQTVRNLLENSFQVIWLQGEISNFIAHGSGHWYFSLKDDKAQISCAMFRNRNRLLSARPASGNQVIVRGKLSLYEPRGNYQFIIEHMEPAGEGLLRQQFEALKKKLEAEGLFAAAAKKPLPRYPSQLGIVTSVTGAAIRDLISVLRRRFSYAKIVIFPTIVQGDKAADSIVQALQLADNYPDNDLIILARGGGSLEDLWAFNEEKVARAVFACHKPLITGIGHEIDFTIADFVADYRAATPSAAAEAATPDQTELLQEVKSLTHRLEQSFKSRLIRLNQYTDSLQTRLEQQHPENRIQSFKEMTNEYQRRLQAGITHLLQLRQLQLNSTNARFFQHTPEKIITPGNRQIETLQQRLKTAMQHTLERSQQSLHAITRTLDSVSPLATMQRGYSVLQLLKDHTVITQSRQVKPGDQLSARLAKGELVCEVKQIKPG